MGYTHYFKELGCTEALVDFAKTAIDLSGVSIRGPHGCDEPYLVSNGPASKLALNGDEELGQDYESFVLPGTLPGEWFCKTARMPYDKVVTAVLLAAIILQVPGWENIGSDGDENDWEASGGVRLFIDTYRKLYGVEVDKKKVLLILQLALGGKSDDNTAHMISELCDSAKKPDSSSPDHPETKTIQILYHSTLIDRLDYVDGKKSDWIDLRAAENVKMKQGDFALISLGISVKLPKGYEMVIVPRSSTFKNFGILQTNSFGVIDETYCGDNDIIRFPALAMRDTEIHVNDRICQFRIQKHQPPVVFEEKDHLGNENRGGFGSTGKA